MNSNNWQDYYYDSLNTKEKESFTRLFKAYQVFIKEEIEVTHTIFLSFLIKILNESIKKGIKLNFIKKSDKISEKTLNNVIETLEEKLENGAEHIIQEGLKNRKKMNNYVCEEIYNNFKTDFNLVNASEKKRTSGTNKGYDSFGNKFIVQELLESYGNMFERYKYFINFLIKKINNAKTKKEINKIPKIASNLSNYKGKDENSYEIEKLRNDLMSKYKEKLKKLK